MQPEIGNIIEGKVTGITNFGVFVELEKGTTGMVHISEVAATYVKDINEFLKEGETVKVKVMKIGDDGKISLSIKRAVEQPPREHNRDNNRERRPAQPRNNQKGYEWTPPKQVAQQDLSFEDMMNKFKQSSDEKMSEIKRNMDSKRGSRRGYK